MGGFRRFILFVFSLAGIACLAALALPWLGYFQAEVAELEHYEWYYIAMEVCLAMTAAWLVFNLLRALFSRRPRRSISVMDIDGGQITVTKDAVASQASHVIEESGVGRAKNVDVDAGKGGSVNVKVKVAPHESIDIIEAAPALHEALVSGLSAMVGERLGTVDLEFLEPKQASSLASVGEYDEDEDAEYEYDEGTDYEDAEYAGDDDLVEGAAEEQTALQGTAPQGTASAEPAEAASVATDATGDITIPMRAEREE